MHFCYKLGGFEPEYSEWSNLRNVSYINLKPGTYQFTVISQNGDKIQSQPSKPIIIIKKPYLWQRLWLQILVGLIIVGVAVLIVWIKIHRIRRYQIELENKVEERTHDLKLEKEKSERLLLNILPAEVAKELTEKPAKQSLRSFRI